MKAAARIDVIDVIENFVDSVDVVGPVLIVGGLRGRRVRGVMRSLWTMCGAYHYGRPNRSVGALAVGWVARRRRVWVPSDGPGAVRVVPFVVDDGLATAFNGSGVSSCYPVCAICEWL